MPTLDIVIVNWNAGKQLTQCLASIADSEMDSYQLRSVIVVDNASTDDSLAGIGDTDLPLNIMRNESNLGFGAACNQGASRCDGDYILFLNPDTRVAVDSIATPVRAMEATENQQTGICGIQLVDESGSVSRSCARFPTLWTLSNQMIGLDRLLPRWFPSHFMLRWDHKDTREVDQVMGAFYFVRSTVFTTLAGFDTRFFVYFEDLDFSLRALNAGWKSLYLTSARAYHKGGGTSEQVRAERLFYFLRSRILYAYKHFGRGAAQAHAVGTFVIEPLSRLLHSALRGSGSSVGETFRAFQRLYAEASSIIRTAKLPPG